MRGVDPTVEQLIDPAALDALAGLMGDDTRATLEELEQSVSGYIAILVDPDASPADVERAAHTAASSTLTVGLVALGEAARRLEIDMPTLTPEARLERAGPLVELAARSFAALWASREYEERG